MLVPGPVNWNLASDVPPSTSSLRVPVRLNEWGSDRSKKTSKKELALAARVLGAPLPVVSACPLPVKLAGRMLLSCDSPADVVPKDTEVPSEKFPLVAVVEITKGPANPKSLSSICRRADVTMGIACAGATDRNALTAKVAKRIVRVIAPSPLASYISEPNRLQGFRIRDPQARYRRRRGGYRRPLGDAVRKTAPGHAVCHGRGARNYALALGTFSHPP